MNKTALIASGVALAGAALAVFVVLPAEMGYDPTGVGEQLGLTEIADPVGPELERGMARMAEQDVLVLATADLPPAEGVADAWQVELGPFEFGRIQIYHCRGRTDDLPLAGFRAVSL